MGEGRLGKALAQVNPIVIGLYIVHVLALAVVYGSAVVEYGSLFWPTVFLAILTTVELLAAIKYLDRREALERNLEREKSGKSPGRLQGSPFTRADSGGDS